MSIGISVEDMEADFPVRIDGRKRNLDIAIFHHGQEHFPIEVSG
jgi:type I restriction enzyme M protein